MSSAALPEGAFDGSEANGPTSQHLQRLRRERTDGHAHREVRASLSLTEMINMQLHPLSVHTRLSAVPGSAQL
jgi:hypothetical protein